MNYKLYVFCPGDAAVIDAIVNAAANAGAGVIGNYTHGAFIQRGQGSWFARQGAQAAAGSVNQLKELNWSKKRLKRSTPTKGPPLTLSS